jgi:hypothetical protein
MMAELRKYGVETKILFPLITRDAVDFEGGASHASGDTKISKDEGDFANTSNAFVHEGNGIYSITLDATEMQAARIVVIIIDSATKVWEDQAVNVATYGNASGQHAFDLDDAQQTVDLATDALSAAAVSSAGAQEIADEIFRMTTATIEGAGGGTPAHRTLYGLVAAMMHLHERDAGDNNIIIYEADDTTVLATIPITKDSGLDPIKKVDPPA